MVRVKVKTLRLRYVFDLLSAGLSYDAGFYSYQCW